MHPDDQEAELAEQLGEQQREEEEMERWWKTQYQDFFDLILSGETLRFGTVLIDSAAVDQQMNYDECELLRDAFNVAHIDHRQAGEILDMAKRNSIKALLEQYKQNLWDAEKAEPDDVDFFEYREAI